MCSKLLYRLIFLFPICGLLFTGACSTQSQQTSPEEEQAVSKVDSLSQLIVRTEF